jgi:glycosyltransferase involved in cell wall biosynthesis
MMPRKIALVHDWLTGIRGGEHVLEAIAELFPQAQLFTLLESPGFFSPGINRLKRHHSPLQGIPGIEKKYRHFLPLMPYCIERFNLEGFDLILSSSHCVAKGIRKPPGSLHISYIHAPMRYMWDRFDDYFHPKRASWITRWGARIMRKRLQHWDQSTSKVEKIDHLLANSHYTAYLIKKHYQREATVIHPFVDLEKFHLPRKPEPYYLLASAFAPYKRIDLAIEAFHQLQLPLRIVGTGQNENLLKSKAGSNIAFLGQVSDQELAQLYAHCRAFLFPGIEDFGITPLEAMASGAPVIAYQEAGALETVLPETGIFFAPQTQEALIQAIQKMEAQHTTFDPQVCQKQASKFSRKHFQTTFQKTIESLWEKHQESKLS